MQCLTKYTSLFCQAAARENNKAKNKQTKKNKKKQNNKKSKWS